MDTFVRQPVDLDALMTGDLYRLAADQPDALALLRLAHTDAEEQWTTPQLRVEVACRRLGRLVDVDSDSDPYLNLREAVEMWLEADSDLRDDLTPDEADGEVLFPLFRLLHGVSPCQGCFRLAYRIDMLRPEGACEKHRQVAA